MSCYHKEAFGLGIMVAFFIFVIVLLFEDAIRKGIERILRNLK